MQSKSVLWLGLLFVLLLIVFCIAKYMDRFYPNVQTVTIPTKEIMDKDLDLKPIEIDKLSKEKKSIDIDNNYLKVVKLVEKEEKDIEKEYNKALLEKKDRSNKPKTASVKTDKIKPVKKPTKINKKKPRVEKKSREKKSYIETILDNQTLKESNYLTDFEKYKLKKLVKTIEKNPSSFLRIEVGKKSKKLYMTKRYLNNLGISSKDIHVFHKKVKKTIMISDSNHDEIDISVIKKD